MAPRRARAPPRGSLPDPYLVICPSLLGHAVTGLHLPRIRVAAIGTASILPLASGPTIRSVAARPFRLRKETLAAGKNCDQVIPHNPIARHLGLVVGGQTLGRQP